MSSQPTAILKVQAGGALNPHKHIYILRPEDEELRKLLLEGEYANVLTSRQTGKTSLVFSTIDRLRKLDLRTAYVDLTAIGTPRGVDEYYKGLLSEVSRALKLSVNVADWWQRHSETSNQRLMEFFLMVCKAADAPAVIFLDEIDSTLKFNYTDDLFAALRAMYNARPQDSAYERISFCLVGVATPNELVKDRRATAYNVGVTLELRDFDAARDELASLAKTLGNEPKAGNAMLARVLHWTDGHPYLTMRVVKSMIERGARSADDVDQFFDEEFQTLDRASRDVHFAQILSFIGTRLSHGVESLSLYQRILDGEKERDTTPTLAHTELKLSGLVKRNRDGFLVVRNPIYARLFDRRWVDDASARARADQSRRVNVLEKQLRERESLAALGVTIAKDEGKKGNAVKFLLPITQEKFAEAVPLLRGAAAPVVSLNLGGKEVSDISALEGLAQLQSLDLERTRVSDISALKGLAQLQKLNIGSTRVSDISALKGLAQLQSLNLGGTEVSDISALEGLAQLQSLDLEATRVSDISALKGLAQLQKLNIGSTQVSDISALKGLAQLQSLTLRETRVSDIISTLVGLANLESLDIEETRVAEVQSLNRERSRLGFREVQLKPAAQFRAKKLSKTQIDNFADKKAKKISDIRRQLKAQHAAQQVYNEYSDSEKNWDYYHATHYMGLDTLYGRGDMWSILDPDFDGDAKIIWSYFTGDTFNWLGEVWLRDVLELRAYEIYLELRENRTSSPEQAAKDMLDALEEFRKKVVDPGKIRVSSEARKTLVDFVTQQYLIPGANALDQNKIRPLIIAKKDRIKALRQDANDVHAYTRVKNYVSLFYENIIDAVLDVESAGTTIQGAATTDKRIETGGTKRKGETAKENLVKAFQASEQPASSGSSSSASGISIINCFEAMVLRYYVIGLAPFFPEQNKVDTPGTEHA